MKHKNLSSFNHSKHEQDGSGQVELIYQTKLHYRSNNIFEECINQTQNHDIRETEEKSTLSKINHDIKCFKINAVHMFHCNKVYFAIN